MSPFVIGLLGLLVLVILLFCGMKVGIAMGIVGFVGMLIIRGPLAAMASMISTPFAVLTRDSLMVIPMFTLMGVACAYGGISGELYSACYKFISRMRGGLAIATEVACAFFAAICGSSTATTASMGKICLPEMDKYNYKRTLTTGSISAGGTLGILIPPSVGFMLYGINSGVGVGQMFISGILPGVLLTICYALVIVVVCYIDKEAGPKGEKYPLSEKLKALAGILPVLVLFGFVMGGILFGWFSASEGAAMGAFGAFVFMVIRRRFTLQNVVGCLKETIATTAMIFLIMIGADILTNFFTAARLPALVQRIASSATVGPWVILIILLLIYAILGCFIDSLPLIVLLTPIFLPAVQNIAPGLGFVGENGIFNVTVWFGVLMVMLMQFGLMTPPVGMCCYVMAGVAKDTPLTTIFKGTAPFLIGIGVAIVIVCLFPALATWLPSVMQYGAA
ncbi:MAG: TRAP transporter large permease [Clostridiales Family XIII bacterium]|nr:TRAP transporter large permease [Clostridiales Family XIII bacterium]